MCAASPKGNSSLGTQPLSPSNCQCPLGSHKDGLFAGRVGPVAWSPLPSEGPLGASQNRCVCSPYCSAAGRAGTLGL